MKKLWATFFVILAISSFAHEGGHGELVEGGKFGGVTSPVVDNGQAGIGNKATFLYKAELVRAEDGKLSLYIFDNKMNLQNLSVFADKIEAKLEVKKKGKFRYVGNFNLKKNKNHFVGKLPQVDYKPFNIDFFLMKGTQKLFIGFSNLD
ncbi:MAG: hypothetical protein KBD63_07345 [Bacteriovoracaceae bacterium]|nr:hypothetical protein [Bacteriovoracaceae bacterium]